MVDKDLFPEGPAAEVAVLRRRIDELETREARLRIEMGALKGSAEVHRRLVDDCPIGIYRAARDGRILYGNQALATILELPLADLLEATNLIDYCRRREECQAFLAHLKTVKTVQSLETEIVSVRGVTKHVLFNAVLDGQGFSGTLVDISDRKQVEEALKSSEARYRAILEDQTELICRFLPDGTLTFVNDAYCRYFHKRREDLIGRSFLPLIPSEDQEMVHQQFSSLAPENPLVTYEHRVIMPDGAIRWQRWTDRAIYGEGRQLIEYQSVGHDITARKQADEELRCYREQLEELVKERTAELAAANRQLQQEIGERERTEVQRLQLITELEAKNAELERFTYTVSHDLKSPLITIKGFLALLEKDLARDVRERLAGHIRRIANAADKMKGLLDDLLELSRVGRLVAPSEHVDLGDLARKASDLFAGRLSSRGVMVEIAANMPQVFADPKRLQDVLQNLIDNAIKFMGNQPEPRIEIGGWRGSGEVVFFVRDNGMGIEPRYHAKIFELFDKLNPHIEGSGVGLALAKRIIELHGGHIRVESAGPGYGSAFICTLPERGESEWAGSESGGEKR